MRRKVWTFAYWIIKEKSFKLNMLASLLHCQRERFWASANIRECKNSFKRKGKTSAKEDCSELIFNIYQRQPTTMKDGSQCLQSCCFMEIPPACVQNKNDILKICVYIHSLSSLFQCRYFYVVTNLFCNIFQSLVVYVKWNTRTCVFSIPWCNICICIFCLANKKKMLFEKFSKLANIFVFI